MPYLLGIAVLLPVTLGMPWAVERWDSLAQGITPPRASQVGGGTGDLAGSTWTFLGTAAADAYTGTQGIDAAFTVRPESQLAADRLYSHCSFRAVDGSGSTWDEGSRLEDNLELPTYHEMAQVSSGCSHPEIDGPGHLPVGEESLVVVHFIVPDDRVSDLRFEVEVATNDPDVDYEETDEEWEEEMEDLLDNPEKDNDNPPRPEALSFSTGTGLDYAELDAYTFDAE